MRTIASVACVLAVTTGSVAPGHAQDSFDQPSCIASTLPGARAQSRFVPPEAKGEPARLLRGVVLRSATWKPGDTIKICFGGGTQKAQERVIRYAREWLQYANVVLDFEVNGAPRKCAGDNHEDVKITFMDGKGWWSLLGVMSRKQDPSMNFQYWGYDEPKFANGQPVPESDIRTTVLHEFGHALGLLHEHQSPVANCDQEIDWDVAYKLGAGMGWEKPQVDRNFRQLVNSDEFNTSQVDRKSIMHYSLPPQIFRRGRESQCWVAQNTELSETDRRFMASLYPKEDKPVVVSSAPNTTVTRGIAKRPVAREDLVKQYEDLLKQSGVDATKARELVTEFRKTVGGK